MRVEASPVEAWELLAAAADPVRWRLLAALRDGGTRCVCDLQPVAGVASNLLSYHLKVLREAGLVRANRRGRWIDYTLADGAAQRLRRALPVAITEPPTPARPVVTAAGAR
ncbi:metalloregulator ArsR/SmtB family transcription factor [Actinoplanes sp. NPDC049316]|uniref:ArsR/SmtB family transcription factor n=1 Tax=Actinoplanes sp. NPDC049316 TaxID=3154727 RepID=UPI0034495C20